MYCIGNDLLFNIEPRAVYGETKMLIRGDATQTFPKLLPVNSNQLFNNGQNRNEMG